MKLRSGQSHHSFFKAGIVVLLTAGAAWGALLLLRIARHGSFTSVSTREINAHGQAQIFGWVGLFVMGAAFALLPRLFGTPLRHPRLAVASGALLVAGVLGRSVAEPLAARAPFLVLGFVAASAEIVAAILFAVVLLGTMRRRVSREPADGYFLVGVLWFVTQAVYEAALFFLTATAGSREDLLGRVATFQAPLRDLQIHGFALFMILGMTQRYLVPAYALPRISRTRSLACLAVLIAGVVGEGVGLVALRLTGNGGYAGVVGVSILLLAVAVGALVLPWRLHDPPRIWDPSLKFVRAGYIWLSISLGMLLLMPVYLRLTGQAFSHAYYGAARHAITVGFVSLMIMGIAARTVGGSSGGWSLGSLRLPFALVNIGCGLRVLLQAGTDLTPVAYRLVGVSGLLEVSGLALWGARLFWAMRAQESAAGVVERAGTIPAIRRERVAAPGGAD